MEKKSKSLLKLTFKEKQDKLLALDKITAEDLKILTPRELEKFQENSNLLINNASQDEKELLLEKFDLFIPYSDKNKEWEFYNHGITQAIHRYLNQYNMLPSKAFLEKELKLSRKTIDKHFKEFDLNVHYVDYLNQMKFMTHKVVSKLLISAINGDVKASRLFLEITGQLNKDQGNATYIKNQNNYLQINNTRLTEEAIKQLPQEKLLQIEELINGKEINNKVP